jgi:hypothetical protein
VPETGHIRCSVCRSPDIAEIEAALAGGGTIRDTSRRFSVSRSALSRHRVHATPAPPADLTALGAGDPGARLNALYAFAQETLKAAEASGSGNLIVDAHSEVRLTLEALGRLHREPAHREPLPEHERERLAFESRKAVTILGKAETLRDRIRAQANLRRLLEALAAALATRPALCRYVAVTPGSPDGVAVAEWYGRLEEPGFGRGGGVRYVSFLGEPVHVRVPQLDHPPTRIVDLFVPWVAKEAKPS